MKILSIETSCDDTGISILEVKKRGKIVNFKILANTLSSQIKIHSPYGGVYPSLAKREHIKNLPILLEKVLKKSKMDLSKINAIAVTSGPGLEPALWTGIVFAKELAKKLSVKKNIPIIPVNHMEGHIFSVFAKDKGEFKIPKINFPALSLLVSGGHTELVLMKDWNKYEIIGETLDDAVGEAFDKTARMLELPYPGGPEISKLAEKLRKISSRKNIADGSLGRSGDDGQRKFLAKNFRADSSNILSELIVLPRPMIYSKNFDFSFSGLKTAVLYLIRDLKKEHSNILQNDKIKEKIAIEFENAVVETLVYKTKKAIEKYSVKTLIVAGGVSANKHLKKEIKKLYKKSKKSTHKSNLWVKILFPEKRLATDNSIMIAVAGYFQFIKNKKKGVQVDALFANGNLKL